jgi:alkanesulfonate monooxygenase
MIELFSSCPRSSKVARSRFLDYVADVARWSERAGCRGILVPADGTLVDPWMLAHAIVKSSTALCPVIAVQPAYTHPYWLAKQVSSFAYLYGRRVGVSIVGGPDDNAVSELATTLRRIIECDHTAALDGPGPHGKLAPPLPKGLRPEIFLPGSTIHVGVIARESNDHAWAIARSRFPCERGRADESSPHWLTPLRDYDAGCPYLVGSYDVVAAELDRFVSAGRRRFVVDVPVDPEELDHVQIAFARTPTIAASARLLETAAAS